MKKIKRIFLYSLGAVLSFIFGQKNVFAQEEMGYAIYGVEVQPIQETLLGKIFAIFLSPIFIAIFVLALIIGIIIFIKRKKNAKKNS